MHAAAHDCAQPPPEHVMLHDVFSPQPCVQPAPEQVNAHVAPGSHVCVQWPPEHVASQFSPAAHVWTQAPVGHSSFVTGAVEPFEPLGPAAAASLPEPVAPVGLLGDDGEDEPPSLPLSVVVELHAASARQSESESERIDLLMVGSFVKRGHRPGLSGWIARTVPAEPPGEPSEILLGPASRTSRSSRRRAPDLPGMTHPA